jgi:hypothetical protein
VRGRLLKVAGDHLRIILEKRVRGHVRVRVRVCLRRLRLRVRVGVRLLRVGGGCVWESASDESGYWENV